MRRLVRVGLLAASAAATAMATPGIGAGDPEAAERQYRIARRLAAEGTAQAGPALRRVVELDPDGPLADDALLDLADLEGVAQWPEALGRASEESSQRARAILAEIVEGHPRGDRVIEARLRLALLRLEPLRGRNAEQARVELLAIATHPDSGSWGVRARYAVAWLDEIEGRTKRAADAYQRIVVDAHHDPAAVRSAVGSGRLAMRSGRFGIASVWLQHGVERAAPPSTKAADLRELAVRGVLREQGGSSGWSPSAAERVALGTRAPAAFERLADGGWLVADRKSESASRLDPNGRVVEQWSLGSIHAATVDPFGRRFVAAGAAIYRLADGEARAVGAQGALAPVSSIAVDAAGGVWMLDRRGGRVGRLDPAGSEPEVVWEDREVRLGGIVWDGRRLVGVDLRGAGLLAIGAAGSAEVYAPLTLAKPLDLAVDAAGQVAVLDGRSREVVLVGPDGGIRARLALSTAGIEKPTALSLGPDGSLDVFDDTTATIVRIP